MLFRNNEFILTMVVVPFGWAFNNLSSTNGDDEHGRELCRSKDAFYVKDASKALVDGCTKKIRR